MRRFAYIALMAATMAAGQTVEEARTLVNQGVSAFKSARYADAVELFRKAIQAAPSDPVAHLYLGTAEMSQFIPGSEEPANLAHANAAEQEFQTVINLQPGNVIALESLASLKYNRVQGNQPIAAKTRLLDDAAFAYEQVLRAKPDSKTAHYSLGVIAWSKFYPELMAARHRLEMRPEDPGPLRDAGVRADLRSRFDTVVTDGMKHLEEALKIDPGYSDAMAYMNLLVRERADLHDSAEQYKQDVQVADNWVQRALEAKRSAAAQMAPPPLDRSGVPTQIRVGGNVQAAKLIDAPKPEYPPLAMQARIQGVVRYTATIGKDGTMQNLTLVSGHPLLVPSATEAVRRYRYQPTLLNGQPVEVVTQIDVPFTL